jgi:DNA repair ATPase RecN
MATATDGEVDSEAVHTQVERALAEMVEVRKVKSQLTGAKTSIDNAYGIVETIAARVRSHLEEIDSLVAPQEAGSEQAVERPGSEQPMLDL